MESKVLNFPDAMKAAEILSPYIGDSISPNTNVGEFTEELLGKLSPMDFLKLAEIITGKNIKEIEEIRGEEFLEIWIDWITHNPIPSLMNMYHTLLEAKHGK